MYYSYGSDITVYGTFKSEGKGDGLDYVRGKLTIAKGGKTIHAKSLWVGQPESWGAMSATLIVEEGGYVEANSLSVYPGSTLLIDAKNLVDGVDNSLKYNSLSVTGTMQYMVSSDTDLAYAVNNGATSLWLNEGTYDIPNACKGKTLTISGTAKTVLKVMPEHNDGYDYGFDSGNVTFNGVTIDCTENTKLYPGYVRMKGTYNDCTINGMYNTYASSEFNRCTFNVSGDNYNLKTWGAGTVTLDTCTFNCEGKALLMYTQAGDNGKQTVTVTSCTFNDNGDDTVTGKAAIEVADDYGMSYELIITNITVKGFSETKQSSTTKGGTSLGTTVWGNKNLLPTDKLNVVIDEKDVY